MRRLLLLVAFLFTSGFLYAQVSIGVKGGYIFSDLRFKGAAASGIGNNDTHSGGLTSWHADAIVNIPLGQTNFYLQPTLGYVRKGATFSNAAHLQGAPGVYIAEGQRLSLDYIEMPVNLVYKVPLPFGKLVFGAGPYVSYGIFGRYKYALSQNGVQVADNVKKVHFTNDYGTSSTTINIRPWDGGLNAMVSLEFNSNIIVGANYSLGAWNINRVDNGEIKNQYIGVSVGFLFNREDW